MLKARPKAEPPKPVLPRAARNAIALKTRISVISPKDAGDFELSAQAVAAELGWEGNDTWEINGVQVRTARSFLCKTMHEMHQSIRNPDKVTMPTVESVCTYLGLTDADGVGVIRELLTNIEASERRDAEAESAPVLN